MSHSFYDYVTKGLSVRMTYYESGSVSYELRQYRWQRDQRVKHRSIGSGRIPDYELC